MAKDLKEAPQPVGALLVSSPLGFGLYFDVVTAQRLQGR